MRRRKDEQPEIEFFHFRIFAFGSDEELVGAFGSLDQAHAEWQRVRDAFLERWNLWGMPQAWWRFEPDVPDDLRRGPALILSVDDADAWRDLEQRRRRYLVSQSIDPAPDRTPRPFGAA